MRPLIALALLVSTLSAARAADRIVFNRDIRPILSDKCFQCHGPDEKERKSGLRLDVRDSAVKPAKSGAAAIVPGKPEQSELIARAMTDSEDDVMPPPKTGKPLTDREKAIFKQWIAEGAEYQGHWAFIPPARPAVPSSALRTPDSGLTAIDSFLLARLQKDKLGFSPEADRATLIRRVSLDLTGLPPALAEIDAFEKDTSPNAYERVVDRLLRSQHYGEQMAVQWLDFARYADSNGFQTDSSRSMWPWRDWVIRAFNDNLPFDQFTIEQIAGDLLPNATLAQVVATGFNRNHRINGEGGIIPEEWRIENVIDRVETTGFTWLALSLNCCRCHDHKYDPFTQREFYSLFSFFNNLPESGTITGASNRSGGNSEPTVLVPDADDEAALAKLAAKIEAAKAKVAEMQLQLPNLVAGWEAEMGDPKAEEKDMWQKLAVTAVKSRGGAAIRKLEDGSWIAGGKNPDADIYTITAPIEPGLFTGLLLETFPDPVLPKQSLGRAFNGNFVLTGIEAEIAANGSPPVKAAFTRAEADYSQSGYDVKMLLDNDPKSGWAIDGNDPKKRIERKAMFLVDKAIPVPPNATLTIRLIHQSRFAGHNIGRFRLSATDAEPALASLGGGSGTPAAILALLKMPAEKRAPKQQAELEKFFRTSVDNPVRDADYELSAATAELERLQSTVPSVMVMREGTARDAFVLNRGEYDKPGEKVSMAVPAALLPLPKGAPLNRLGFAKWLVDPANPLTARVWVNRAWEKFFGLGICKTTENLGSQSEYPVHPELLDWLATEFVRLGWDMKAMQKQMVMSRAYRQASKASPDLIARDPDNRLLARGPRFRLAGETVRDQALAIGGLLVPAVGGKSVRPYMPEGVWDETSKYGDLRGYKHESGDGLYRRSMYTIWKRTAAPPTMLLFDSPAREVCAVKRSRTNTPLQALALLNEVTFVEAARGLAQRMILEGGPSPESRIAHGYRLASSRRADADAVKLLATGLQKRLAEYKADIEAAKKLITTGDFKSDPAIPPEELAAYTVTASVLLNLDRTITRD